MSKGTPPRSVRIPADLWQAARATASRRGETVTDIIVKALRSYVARHKENA